MSFSKDIDSIIEQINACENNIQEARDDVNRGMELLNEEESRLSDLRGALILLKEKIDGTN